MTDHLDVLDRLADRAPAPPPGLAGTVLARGRASVRRRRLGAVVAAGGTAAAVVIGVLVATGPDSASPPAPATQAASSSAPSEPTRGPGPSDDVQIVAAAVKSMLADHRPAPTLIQLDPRRCERINQVILGHDADCTPWTAQERQDLVDLLAPLARVDFVARADNVSLRRPSVAVAALDLVDTDHGSVFVFAVWQGLNCSGQQMDVTFTATGWRAERSDDGQVVIC